MSLLPGLKSHDERGDVHVVDIVDQVETADGIDELDAVRIEENLLRPLEYRVIALERSAVRQPHHDEKCALVLKRQEPAGRNFEKPVGPNEEEKENRERKHEPPDQ